MILGYLGQGMVGRGEKGFVEIAAAGWKSGDKAGMKCGGEVTWGGGAKELVAEAWSKGRRGGAETPGGNIAAIVVDGAREECPWVETSGRGGKCMGGGEMVAGGERNAQLRELGGE